MTLTAAEKSSPPKSDLRQKIGHAALQLFSTRGFAAVSIRDIAAAAGTSNALIYHYFGNKDGLYRQLVSARAEELIERIQAVEGTTGTPLERLEYFVDAYLAVQSDEPWYRLTVRELFDTDRHADIDLLLDLDRLLRHVLKRILLDGSREGVLREAPSEMCTLAILGILDAFLVRRAAGAEQLPLQAAKTQVLDLYLNGLALRRGR